MKTHPQMTQTGTDRRDCPVLLSLAHRQRPAGKLSVHSSFFINHSSFSSAFTLVELLVSTAVLALLVFLVAQLFSSATAVATQGNKHMDTDAQARSVFDRMAVDFSLMFKRSDIDYYFKGCSSYLAPATRNDQLAFFSQVPGYYPSKGSKSPISIVAYRINSDSSSQYYNKLQRFGCGLVWNGVPASDTTEPPMVFLPLTIATTWPMATNMDDDSRYELAGPQVFRMEYSYVIKGTSSANPSILSDTPWDTRAPTSHTAINGMQDVAAITVLIAVVDPRTRTLVTNTMLTKLAANMNDFTNGMNPGDLEAQWQTAISDPSNGIPASAASAIRVYRRAFTLPVSQTPSP